MNRVTKMVGIGALTLALAGCAGMSNREQGTVVGAGIGAAAGAAIAGNVGGAIGGGIVGGVIGHEVGRDRDERYGYDRRAGYYDRYGNWYPN